MVSSHEDESRMDERFKQAEREIRMGRFDDAERLVAQARQGGYATRSVRTAVWLLLLEGLIAHFRAADTSAHDRILRATALSEASGIHDMLFRSLAWNAFINFERENYKRTIECIARCIDGGNLVPSDARLRFLLVLANCYLYARHYDDAKTCFIEVRELCATLGDRASLSAYLYNQSVFRISDLRVQRLLGELSEPDLAWITQGMESSERFDALAGAASLVGISRATKARLLLLSGRAQMAKDILVVLTDELRDRPQMEVRSGALLDLAWACLDLGDWRGALEALDRGPAHQAGDMDLDDRAVFFALCRRIKQSEPSAKIPIAEDKEVDDAVRAYESSVSFVAGILEALPKSTTSLRHPRNT